MDRKVPKEGTSVPKKDTEHWCEKHKTNWFKKGKMTSYAHPIKDESGNDTGEWCHESKSQPGKPSEATQSTKSVKEEVEAPIDLEWLKESLKFLQSHNLEGWSNKDIVAYLESLTGQEYASVSQAVQSLSKENAEILVDRIKEKVAEIKELS